LFAKTFSDLVKTFVDGTLAQITKLAFLFAFLFFLYRIYVFMVNLNEGAGTEKIKEGKKWLVYAIILFFVFVSIFGLVNIMKNSLKFDNNKDIDLHIDPSF
jgi:uncharacterized membrane protein